MKRIGMIGGMSWESTANYYKWINEEIRKANGGLSSANIVMISVDFKPIEELQRQGKWHEMGEQLAGEMAKLEKAGADFIIMTSNTMHKMAEQYEAVINVPFLHICDATSDRVLKRKFNKVGLLGTAYTMEQDFYRNKLEEKGLEVLIPLKDERDEINRIIFEELCQGKIVEESHAHFVKVIQGLIDRGCQGIILGCTEISMTVRDNDSSVPLFDTARIHCEETAKLALG